MPTTRLNLEGRFLMTRKFGKIVVKPSKAHPKWIEASYLTPPEAFSEWPDLPNRQTATFPYSQDGRDEAAAWLARARHRIEADVWEPERIVKRKTKDTVLTFGEYAAKWLEMRENEGLHVSTIYGIRCTVKRLNAAFGSMPIGKITSADIERFAATLPKDHPYVGRELLSKLRQILAAAATPDQDGIAVIGKSPFTMQVRKPAPREETPAATPRQLRLIHDAMPRKFQLAITLAVSCGGLRIGEVCALQRGDIDLDNRLIHIRRTRLMRAHGIAGPPKTTRSRRTEPIPEAIIPELAAHLDEYVATPPDSWIFPSPLAPDRPISTDALREAYAKARIAAGREDLRFHDLRSTALTMLAQQGATVRELMAAAGHSTATMAMHYQRLSADRQRTLADKVAASITSTQTDTAPSSAENDKDKEIAELKKQIAQLKALASSQQESE